MNLRIEVVPQYGLNRNALLSEQILENESKRFKIQREGRLYKIKTEDNWDEAQLKEVFCDEIIEDFYSIDTHSYGDSIKFNYVIERSFKPGVTDNPGRAASDAMSLYDSDATVFSGKLYYIETLEPLHEVERLAKKYFGNALIEEIKVSTKDDFLKRARFENITCPEVNMTHSAQVEVINLDISNEELLQISQENCLALSLDEMTFIKNYFKSISKERVGHGIPLWPTDVELEVIAQTWSEHCKHKIFSADINYYEGEEIENKLGSQKIEGLYKSFIKSATREIEREREIDWLVSVFEDNAGIVRYDENLDLAIKVETHNSPSALDPYGGALTGILGVNRDILGCGLGARPIANTDVFCFADPKLPQIGDESKLPYGLMNPAQILKGVHQGVEDGGNKSGIPTVNGAMYFDNDYAGKPLVFVGTVGAMPRNLSSGLSHEKKTPLCGDSIYMIGGEIGADGIHGATFSSLELNESSPVTAVQIGDPLTQKKVLDFLIEARDIGLYTSITDNGAGGLSSSVGEMATFTNGAKVILDKCPVKYAGLKPFEIMISESQERMTLSVSPANEAEFLKLAKKYDVLATNIGEFTESGYLEIFYQDEIVAKLDLNFLHNMLPKMKLEAYWDGPRERDDWYGAIKKKQMPRELDNRMLNNIVKDIISSPNVASKENLVRKYDHEVQGATNIKPFVGKNSDGVNNSGGIWLYPHGGESHNGALVGCGLNPKISLYDPYVMGLVAVDEAIRNIVCVGADPDYISLLDNFCWPDPVKSQTNQDGDYKLGQLVRTNAGLYDACKAYGAPLVSGKDSMKNDFRGKNRRGEKLKISVLPTLLVTSLGKYNIEHTVTSDFKKPDHLIYLLGNNSLGLAASELADHYFIEDLELPKINPVQNDKFYRQYYSELKKGVFQSAHDISDGGMITTLLESCFGNNIGAKINLKELDAELVTSLFSETAGRFVVSIARDQEERILKEFKDFHPVRIGETKIEPTLQIESWEGQFQLDIPVMKESWKGVF